MLGDPPLTKQKSKAEAPSSRGLSPTINDYYAYQGSFVAVTSYDFQWLPCALGDPTAHQVNALNGSAVALLHAFVRASSVRAWICCLLFGVSVEFRV